MIPASDQDSESRSASCRRPRVGGPAQRAQGGFTLLELLVVLALVGLVTAVAVPNLERLYAAATREAERDYILDQFAGLGRRAMHQGRNYVVVDAAGPRDSGLPDEAGEGAVPGGEDAGDPAPSLHAAHEPYAIDVPEGWEIRLDPPLVVRANGVCLGAGLTLRHRGREEARIDLEAPYCRVDPDA